ncbi:type II toxin-antitoxin system PemK/MazF family toxin [Patescibacteria group bacterium]|nr:type II toxin-antitoxin system PemK/MazF family toxin [Patescibacteria group bacterium]MBU4512350.1 type II toxin-antitoxin system PemK/MazF family toxin [Patescibacteria group bacterium]
MRIHQYKSTFNAALLTSRRVDKIYPHDYILPEGIMPLLSKVICDQPVLIYKESAIVKQGRVSREDLAEIRKRTAQSLGIKT